MISAIDTHYKGFLFRSRLEARWAVFFDAMGIEWEYESEGYNINGIMYLPDFYLPRIESFAEVKPHGLSDEEIEKVNALALESGKNCILLIDVPSNTTYLVAEPHTVKSIFGSEKELQDVLNDPENYIILSNDHMRCLFYSESGADYLKSASTSRHPHDAFRQAIECARSARFEYGERITA